MASESGRADSSLSQRLAAEPYRYGFFQAVRLLHQLEPDRGHIGEDGPVGRETVRFAAEQSLEFPASEIFDLIESEDGQPPTMVVRMMGLTGPLGTLPRHYTELVIQRARKKDRTLASFLDLFNHRFVSFFYRSWEKYRLYTRYAPDVRDQLSTYLFSFFGMGTEGLRDRLALPDNALLQYAGLLAQRPRSQTALENVLSHYFHDVPVSVDQFRGQWLALDRDSLTQMTRFGCNSQLGVDAVVGSRVWHTQSRFRARFGPMKYGSFCDFLPSGSANRPALELTRFFVGQELDFEFQLVLAAAEVPSCQLGSTGPAATRLGWSTWLTSRPRDDDADEVVFDAEALRAYHAHATEGRA